MNTTVKNRIESAPKIPYRESLEIVNLSLWHEHRKKQGCIAKAAVKPMPGPLLGAFMDKAIKVNEHSVCRIVPAHFFILQRIESKLLDMLAKAESESTSKVELSAEEQWDLCWLFTNNPERVYNLVSDGGLIALRGESKHIALKWEAEEIDAVIMAIFEQFKRHIETKVRLLSDMKKDERITFFQEPPRAATMTPMASAGCSSTSASTENIIPPTPSIM